MEIANSLLPKILEDAGGNRLQVKKNLRNGKKMHGACQGMVELSKVEKSAADFIEEVTVNVGVTDTYRCSFSFSNCPIIVIINSVFASLIDWFI